MNELQKIFNYENNQVRTVLRNKEPWFVAIDVCRILDLTNPTMALSRLDEDERAKFNLGRQGEANIVNESGLYELVFASRKEEAKDFRRWIRKDVLPSIRRTGSYTQEKTQAELLVMMAQDNVNKERRLLAVEEKQDNIVNILSLNRNDWRNKVNRIINAIAMKQGGGDYYSEIRKESYQMLEEQGNCILSRRLDNRKARMALAGSSKSAINKISALDVIEEDKKLISVYIAVIKELAVKYQLNISKYNLLDETREIINA